MNRDIEFRGKDERTGKWAFGFLTSPNVIGVIGYEKDGMETGELYGVIPETVGQYTGLLDRNGAKIFEGDIVIATRCDALYFPPRKDQFKVVWSQLEFCLKRKENGADSLLNENVEVIGNIHDNRSLLEDE